jgi:hypothetical protein
VQLPAVDRGRVDAARRPWLKHCATHASVATPYEAP